MCHFLIAIGRVDIQIQDFGGINDLGAFLKAFKLQSGFRDVASIGIVRDAEGNSASAFQSVQTALGNNGLPVPPTLVTPGPGPPRVSAFILPDGNRPGMLETLCLDSVAQDAAMPCVDAYMACLEKVLNEKPKNLEKARLQAFLASRPEKALWIGAAARAGYWAWNDPPFAGVKAFLSGL